MYAPEKYESYNLFILTTVHYWQRDFCLFHQYAMVFHGYFNLHFQISTVAGHLRIIDLLNLLFCELCHQCHFSIVVFCFCLFLSNFKEVFIYFGSSLHPFFVFYFYVVFRSGRSKAIYQFPPLEFVLFFLKKWHKSYIWGEKLS